ncbi:MAG: tetratricopeptide repeat protein [Spirochaetaceae bacterium]|jgi:tetratricopeptide (TPR) repeat protein|nr:tetratricopeptide repeat protein [Spirochaetaceae bacterium]
MKTMFNFDGFTLSGFRAALIVCCLCLIGPAAGFLLCAQETPAPEEDWSPVEPDVSTETAPADPTPAPAQTVSPQAQTDPITVQPTQTPPPAQTQPAGQTPQRPQQQPGPNALQNYRIGRDLEARNRFAEANTHYNEAIRLCLNELNQNGSNMDSYTVLTWSLLRQRRYSEVINWGDRALRVNPGDYRIIETMGEAYFYLNDYEHSLIMMQRYAASMPRGDRASTAYFFMGEIYRNQRKYLHADIAYTTAVTLEGGIFLWWYRLGTVREAAGEYASAIIAYEKVLSLNPGYREASEALERTKRLLAASPQT